MNSCLRSNLLNVASMLVIGHGIFGIGQSRVVEIANRLQDSNVSMTDALIKDSRKAVKMHIEAAEAFDEKKRELIAKGCKL